MGARAAAAWAAAGVIIGCAGCTSSPAHPPPSATRSATVPASAAPPAGALPSPGCSTATAKSPLLSRVSTAMVSLQLAGPFGVAVTPDGRWAFVADNLSVEVLRTGSSLAPVKVAAISMPGAVLGETMTRDGRYLLAASQSGAVVISVARAEQDRPDAVLGMLTDPVSGSGAIEVAVSPNGEYAFVTQEGSQQAAVFNLHRALTQGFANSDFVGAIPLGLSPVGLAVSPDGRWLYATSEVALRSQRSNQGTLTLINLSRAETHPASSVVATVAAGCNPVRVITSADGRQVWVTARESDDLLCFSAAALQNDPARALVATVRVGEAPVGLMLVKNGSLIVVADSNRFGAPGANSSLSVVDVAAALAGKSAVLGVIPAGQFPREMALEPGGQRLLVSNYASGQLEAVSVPSIP
jgi:DNA-binding beta-propeller fold protein YncE